MENETVVLVHGLWMNGLDMNLLQHRIARRGYKVSRFSFNSMTRSPAENAASLDGNLRRIDTPVIHLVCHSLGGLVARHLFYTFPRQKPGKVVTLGTPHRPSYSAWRLSRFPGGSLLLGKSIEDGLLGNVPPWDGTRELGSIAGRMRLGLGMIIPGVPRPNDGSVSVEETRLDNMKDHVVVNASHFGMLLSSRVADQVIAFLEDGRFRSI